MSASNDALLEAFTALLAESGETLTLQRTPAVTVTALVDRAVDRTKRKLEVSFDAERATLIEIRHGAITPAPRVGEYFADALNLTHRIERILPLDGLVVRYRCVTA